MYVSAVVLIVYVCRFEHNCLWWSEDGVRAPGAGVIVGSEPPDVGTGN